MVLLRRVLTYIICFCYSTIFYLCSPNDTNINLCDGEADCFGELVCILGSCKPRECKDILCPEGFTCQPGPVCVEEREDLDGDGIEAAFDCDDSNFERFPGNNEVCDGVDNNCNGLIDEVNNICLEGVCCGKKGCVSISSDRDNCGDCNVKCGLYEICVEGRCREAPPPLISRVEPEEIPVGGWINLKFFGQNLIGYGEGIIFYFEDGEEKLLIEPFNLEEEEENYVTDPPIFISTEKLIHGPVYIKVIRNDGKESNSIEANISYPQAPVIFSVYPISIEFFKDTSLYIEGANFWGDLTIEMAPYNLQSPIIQIHVQWRGEFFVRSERFVLSPIEVDGGIYKLWIKDELGNKSNSLSITINEAPSPILYRVSPSVLNSSITPVQFVLDGDNFWGLPNFYFKKEEEEIVYGPIGASQIGGDNYMITNPIDLSQLSRGTYNCWVMNPDGKQSNWLQFILQ